MPTAAELEELALSAQQAQELADTYGLRVSCIHDSYEFSGTPEDLERFRRDLFGGMGKVLSLPSFDTPSPVMTDTTNVGLSWSKT